MYGSTIHRFVFMTDTISLINSKYQIL